jgi:hypothetical protein
MAQLLIPKQNSWFQVLFSSNKAVQWWLFPRDKMLLTASCTWFGRILGSTISTSDSSASPISFLSDNPSPKSLDSQVRFEFFPHALHGRKFLLSARKWNPPFFSRVGLSWLLWPLHKPGIFWGCNRLHDLHSHLSVGIFSISSKSRMIICPADGITEMKWANVQKPVRYIPRKPPRDYMSPKWQNRKYLTIPQSNRS